MFTAAALGAWTEQKWAADEWCAAYKDMRDKL
jgi:hypothetical protein